MLFATIDTIFRIIYYWIKKMQKTINSFTENRDGKAIRRIYPNDIFYDNFNGIGDGEKGLREINKNWIRTKQNFKIEYSADKIYAPKYSNEKLKYIDNYQGKKNEIHITPINCQKINGEIEKIKCGPYSGECIIYRNAFGEDQDLIYLPLANDFLKIVRIKNNSNKKLNFKFRLEFDEDHYNLSSILENFSQEKVTKSDMIFSSKDEPKLSTSLKSPIVWDDFGNAQQCMSLLYRENQEVTLEKIVDLSQFSSSEFVYADLTFSYNANSASGYIRNFASGTNGSVAGWNSIRSNVFSDSDPNILKTDVFTNRTDQSLAYFYANNSNLNSPILNRAFFGFNTSSLAGKTILSASLNFFFYYWENNTTLNQGFAGFAATKGERGDPNQLLEGDWKKSGGNSNIQVLSNSKFYDDIFTQIFTKLNLNSDGILHINKTGWSDFAVRDLRDINNVYANEAGTQDLALMRSVNYSDPLLRPFLEVEIDPTNPKIFSVNTVPFSNIGEMNKVLKSNINSINDANA